MQKEANLEFRKVPSLEFLYEVREDGKVLRNVKSKRHLKIFVDHHHSKAGYNFVFVNIKNKVRRVSVAKAVAECWLGQKPEGLEIDHINRDSQDNRWQNLRYVNHSEQMRNRVLSDRLIAIATANCMAWNAKVSVPVIVDGERFGSIYAAARHLAVVHGVTVEHMRGKLKSRRSNIYGHTITYLNAETRHGDREARVG